MSERLKLQEGWSSFFALMAMLMCAAVSISAARWTEGLDNLTTAALLGFLAGFLLARSRFPDIIAHLFSLVYGVFTIGYLMGRLIDQPSWVERLAELSDRIVTWLSKATSGGTSRDSLMFVLLLAALFWLLGHISAWYTFRRPRLWRVLLPIGLTMLVNYYVYTDPRISAPGTASLVPLAVVAIMAALLYIVRTNVFLHEVAWQNAHVSYSTELRLDFVRSGVVLTVLALIVMTLAPGAKASPQLSEMWSGVEDVRDSVRDTVLRLFGSLDTRGRGVGNPFGDRALLGGARDLGDEVLFDVSAGRGRYWQAMVYDRYTGDSWLNTDDKKLLVPAGDSFNDNTWRMRAEMTQTVTIYLPNTTQLFAAPEPVRVPGFSTEVSIAFDRGNINAVSSVSSRRTLQPGNVYQIVSAVSRADTDSLRAAGQEYPDWVKERYLQLPSTVTDRTRALAQEITAGYDNVYDQATAIEQYLRQNLRYNLTVPAPPEGQDFVDFVLFDLGAGYCDYYATSFVVLARSIGIPARITFGYAQDEYSPEAKAYRVRAKNGHSWPEVFFPEYGWIQFEPTVVIDPIDRPQPPAANANTDPITPNSLNQDNPDERDSLLAEEPDMEPGAAPEVAATGPSSGVSPVFFILLGVLVVGALSAVAVYWAVEQRGMSGMNLIERAYARMWRFAAWLGVPSPPDQTPFERAEALAVLVPEGHEPIQRITGMYVVERFGRGSGNDGATAEQQWSLLRLNLWKSWLQKKFGRLQQEQKRRWDDVYTPRTGSGDGQR